MYNSNVRIAPLHCGILQSYIHDGSRCGKGRKGNMKQLFHLDPFQFLLQQTL